MKTWRSKIYSTLVGKYCWNYLKLEDGTIIRNRIFLNDKDPYGEDEWEDVYYRKEKKGWLRLKEAENGKKQY